MKRFQWIALAVAVGVWFAMNAPLIAQSVDKPSLVVMGFESGTVSAQVQDRHGFASILSGRRGGKGEQYVETQVRFEDGRTGKVAATLKIVDVPTFAAVGRAA